MSPLAVLFDMDGVLVNNYQYHVESWFAFGEKYGLGITQEVFDKNIAGHSTQEAIQLTFKEKLTPEDVFRLSQEKELLYRKIYQPHIQEVNGLTHFLRKLKQANIPCAVATSALPENITFTLEALNITDYFSATVSSLDVENAKPAPDIYLKAAQDLGIAPQNCIVIEDSRAGIKAGKAAKCSVIALTTSHKATELYTVEPHFIVQDFTELSVALLTQIQAKCV